MSPIFRHGRLRLYLLKLLDEAPRHGYEVIRLLQDRFMGVYSPSPGTIYPRLARLEEDGLVTHDEVDGRKVYRITDKGREEIRARLDDLAELEEELTESVRDIAREVSEDVRDTVRSLREEITWAARDIRKTSGGRGRAGHRGRGAGPDEPRADGAGAHGAGADRAGSHGAGPEGNEPRAARESASGTGAGDTAADHAGPRGAAASDSAASDRTTSDRTTSDATASGAATGGRGASEDGADATGQAGADQGARDAGSRAWGSDDAKRIRDEARRARDDMRDAFRAHRQGQQERGRQDWGRQDWGRWSERAGFGPGQEGKGGRPGRGGWPGTRPGGSWQDWAGMSAGLERLASDFARELRSAAGHAGDVGEGALGDLRDILADTLARIRDEVFPADRPGDLDDTPTDSDQTTSDRADSDRSSRERPADD